MLSGRAPFACESVAESLATVLRDNPPPVGAEAREVPAALESLVGHCLEKRCEDRFQSASDMGFALRAIAGSPSVDATPSEARRRPSYWLAAAGVVLGLITGIAGTRLWWWPAAGESAPVHLSLLLSAGSTLAPNDSPEAGSSLAISRDGRWIAYVVLRAGERYLAVRSLDRPEETVLPATAGALSPVFSPDARWIAYLTETDLRKVPLTGGAPTTICAMPPVARGATWSDNDTIYFSPSFSAGLQGVSAGGGQPQDVTTVDRQAGESNHLLPEALPGGGALLFTVWKGGDFSAASIWSLSLRNHERRLLIESASGPRYVAPGFLVFGRGGSLFAVRFDAERLTLSADAVPVVDGVWTDPSTGTTHAAVSRSGTVVYAPGGETTERRRLEWLDRQGHAEPLGLDPLFVANPRLSPDGRRIAIESLNDLWVYDLNDTTLSRVTFRGVNQHPVWSPDGRRLAFSSSQAVANPSLFWTDIDGGGQPEPLSAGTAVQFPTSWSNAGNVLAYAEIAPETEPSTGWDIRMIQPGEVGPSRTLVRSQFKDDQPALSPDGHALAYVSDETGKLEVYFGYSRISAAGPGSRPTAAPNPSGRATAGSCSIAVAVNTSQFASRESATRSRRAAPPLPSRGTSSSAR